MATSRGGSYMSVTEQPTTDRPSRSWTEEDDGELRRLLADGQSASMIGAAVGRSRNSVISRVHRLGLASGRVSVITAWSERKRGPNKRRMEHSAKTPVLAAPPPKIEAAPPAAVASEVPVTPPAPSRKLVSFWQLTDRKCKWPLGTPGEPGFGFCGRPRWESSPYCGEHCRMAYQPPAARRRDRTRRAIIETAS